MVEEPEDGVLRDSEVAILKQSTPQKALLWPTVTKEISARMTTLVIRDLQPGRTYDFTAKVWDGSAYGPETSVSATLGMILRNLYCLSIKRELATFTT